MYTLVILMLSVNLLAIAERGMTVTDRDDRSTRWRLKVTPDFGCLKERSSVSIYCLNVTNNATSFANSIQWIKIFSDARIWSDDHRLYFPSIAASDEGSYCCRTSQSLSNLVNLSALHGCTGSTTARISVAAEISAPLQANNMQKIASSTRVLNSNSNSHAVTRSVDTGWRLEVNPTSRCVLLGKSATVNCLNFTAKDVVNFAKNIQWFKILDGGGLDPITTSRQGRVRSDGHQLRFSETDASDDGRYCCKTLPGGLERGCSPLATATIAIALPPVISTLKHQVALRGETVTLRCGIASKGQPAASVFLWQRHGKNLLESLKYYINTSENGTSLMITNATAEDEGYYSCVVQNPKAQSDNKSVYLFVQPPKPLGCNAVNNFYSLTIGLQAITKDCSPLLQNVVVDDVVSKFLLMKCNCSSGLCIDISSDFECSHDSIMTVHVILKGEQAQALQNETNAILQRGPVTIESMGISYSLICVVKTLCHGSNSNSSSNNPLQTDNDDSNGNVLVVVAIGVPILLVGLFAVLLVFVVAVMYQCTKRSLSSISNADKKSRCSPSSTPHHIEDGNVTTRQQSPTSSITLQFDSNNCETITVDNSSRSSLMCNDGGSSRSSADFGVDSADHNKMIHPSGLNCNGCNVYQSTVSSDQLALSQSITPLAKTQPSGEPNSLALPGPAHSMWPSSVEHNNLKSEQDSMGDE